jgi:hypothetical protein
MRMWMRSRAERESGCGQILTGEAAPAAPAARRGLTLLILGALVSTIEEYEVKQEASGRLLIGAGRGRGDGEGGRTCATPTAQQWRAGEPRQAHRAPRRGFRACLVQTNWRVCRTWLEGWVGWMRRRLAMKECDGKWSKTHRDARPSARSPPARWLACALSLLCL